MNKKQVLATLALSTIALAQAGYVSADELAPIDSSAPTTEVVTPTTPSASTETEAPAVQPTEPSVTPVDPTAPSDKDNAGSLDGVPADKPAPSDKPQDKDNAGSLDGVPTPSDKPQDKDNAGSLDGVPADKPAPSDKAQDKDNAGSLDGVPNEQPKTTDQANQQGKSQIGTTSTSTGQVVHDVTKEPVETNTGASIVSTQNGNVVLSDGSVVAPEEVGGTVNEDKTISVTDSEGKLKTLPNTGTAESILGAIGAMLLTAVSYVYKKKMF
ncbi:LPXTG-motif cell wall anchor domain protein [Streptococcus oralis]|uniref:LPXTG-motif cell wall anchor domain protein n=1 Tax=Streptococcus oralis TaxID=1303 RepID=A0A081R354_STROR|nr:LPXTG cell wall anchor domain-containing protein [Streptococcus oralis]KEQ49627.1 LPXTG-motif cell wall anchor domain protein [Streptococcus oralis]